MDGSVRNLESMEDSHVFYSLRRIVRDTRDIREARQRGSDVLIHELRERTGEPVLDELYIFKIKDWSFKLFEEYVENL